MLKRYHTLLKQASDQLTYAVSIRWGLAVAWILLGFNFSVELVYRLSGYSSFKFACVYSLVLYVILFLLIFCGAYDFFVLLKEDARKHFLNREYDSVFPITRELCDKFHTPIGCWLYIVDNMKIDCYSLCYSIVISRGCLELLGKDELTGMLAHEMAHLKNMDTIFNLLVMYFSNILFTCLLFISNVFKMLARHTGEGIFSALFRALGFLFSAVPKLVYYPILMIFNCGRRQNELKADKLAADMGYKDQVLKALNFCYDFQMKDTRNLGERAFADHPQIAIRIAKLEYEESQGNG